MSPAKHVSVRRFPTWLRRARERGAALDLADPSMRNVIDEIGASYGWEKTEASGEWWHVNYVGP